MLSLMEARKSRSGEANHVLVICHLLRVYFPSHFSFDLMKDVALYLIC